MSIQDAFAPGDLLGERYALKKAEWSSPLGAIWLARDRVLDRPVLIQLLRDDLTSDPEVRKRFLKAAARSAQMTHAGILRVFDIGDEPAFVVLEHAAGGRLAERLRSGSLRVSDAARAALAIARGLEALHERGGAHGSLAPTNVLFDAEGRAKMLVLSDAAPGVHGVDPMSEQPPGYRPPESDPLPSEADRFALAALTYHMLTGSAPDGRSHRLALPSAIESLLRRALSAEPARRPSLDEFIGALAPFARVELPQARGPRLSASEFRWLIPVVLIIAIAALAGTIGVSVVQNLARERETPAEASPSPTVAATQPIDVSDVSDFDPQGDGQEGPEDVVRAIDGDARTVWRTTGYASPDLGGIKEGVGLLFDLGEEVPLRSVRVQSTLEGWEAQIRVASDAGEDAEDFARAATFTATTQNDVPMPAGTSGRYVLLWITSLANDDDGERYPFRAEVAEVEFFAV
jgi:hypothetical protein